jgi:hypothetical protein
MTMAVDGVYQVTTKSPMGAQKGTLTLKADGEALSGSMADAKNANEFSGGKVNGNDFQFTVELKTPMGKMKAECKGTVDGDKISGTTKTPFGPAPFEGTRV